MDPAVIELLGKGSLTLVLMCAVYVLYRYQREDNKAAREDAKVMQSAFNQALELVENRHEAIIEKLTNRYETLLLAKRESKL